MSIGERLKKLRRGMKKTLRETSESFGMSLNTVYRWEHELSAPRKSALKKVAEFYGVSREWILTGEGGKENSECDGCPFNPGANVDQRILMMLRRLSENNKHKVIGYMDRIYLDEENTEQDISEA